MNRLGGWFTVLSNLIIRDLKVSNLLMTDKGCVKIGESAASLRQPRGCSCVDVGAKHHPTAV